MDRPVKPGDDEKKLCQITSPGHGVVGSGLARACRGSRIVSGPGNFPELRRFLALCRSVLLTGDLTWRVVLL
jgi:hypothetical protein